MAVLSGVVLTGCTPMAGALPSPSPSVTSTPTSRPQAAPGEPRIAVTCSQLSALTEMTSVLGGTPVEVDPATEWSSGAVASFRLAQRAALFQLGGQYCVFGSPVNGTVLTVQMLPLDGPWTATGDVVPGADAWSDEAVGGCGAGTDIGCNYDIRVGQVWINIDAAGWGEPLDRLDALRTDVDALAAAISHTVGALPDPIPAWRGGSPAAPDGCDAWGLDGTTALGVVGLAADPALIGSGSPVVDEALANSGALECAWAGGAGGSVHLLMLPGGAWAWADHPPLSNASLTLSPVDGLGERAFAGCGEWGGCTVHVVVGDAWIVADLGVSDTIGVADAVEFTRGLIARL